MTKKVGIVTINDNNNYGNRLQNYAVKKKIQSLDCDSITLKNHVTINSKDKFFIRVIKFILKKFNINIKIPEYIWYILLVIIIIYGILRNIPLFSFLSPTEV